MSKLAALLMAGVLGCASGACEADTFVINYHYDPPTIPAIRTRTYTGTVVALEPERGSLVFRAAAPGEWTQATIVARSGFEGARNWSWLVPTEFGGSWESASGDCALSTAAQTITLDCSID